VNRAGRSGFAIPQSTSFRGIVSRLAKKPRHHAKPSSGRSPPAV
jgi:hypothetical protein